MLMTDHETEFEQRANRAEAGDPQAQFELAGAYYSGQGVAIDRAAAARWYQRAAEQGHAPSQFNLGYISDSGDGVPQDEAAAHYWYGQAAEQGLAVAQHNLGGLHERNERFTEAARWYRLAADQGHAPSQASLAFALSNGRGIAVDEALAASYYRRAAEQGFAPAQFNLAGMLLHGRGLAADPAEAAHWYRQSAEQGYASAEQTLANLYADGIGVPATPAETIRWQRRAAEHGLLEAQRCFGIYYATGRFVTQDKALALVWFTLAALQGDTDSRANLQILGPISDPAISDLVSRAGSGDAEAQRELACRLHDGTGIQADPVAADLWLRKAAESGDTWSQTTLALRLRGTKDPAKERESIHWLSLAAGQHDARAHFNLGLQQLTGIGTPADVVPAIANILMASLAGLEDARPAFEKLRPSIPDNMWPRILDQVTWPDLLFIMGPLADGHLDHVRESQEQDDGSDDTLWLKYERETAETLFGEADTHGSVLDSAFDAPVLVRKYFVGRARIDGKTLASITISLRNIVLANGFPVYWMPNQNALSAVTSMIGMITARTWVRWNYLQY